MALGNAITPAAAFWASMSDILIDIELGTDGGDSFSSLIRGPVDSVSIDPIMGMIRIEGRDYTANISAANTQESFVNRTSSEIVSIIAARHSLKPVVTKTNTLVGTVDPYNRSILSLHQSSKIVTDWDMLVFLAELERFSLYVEGTDLHFESRDIVPPRVLNICPNKVSELKMERLLSLGSGIQVTVNSWDRNQMQAVSLSVDSSSGPSNIGSIQSETQTNSRFFLTRPNLPSADATLLAQRQLYDIGSHERVIEFEMPGELIFAARDTVQLSGTDTSFDQSYQIETIDRHIGPSSGFVERIRAKSASQ
jgi:hypothetical protein